MPAETFVLGSERIQSYQFLQTSAYIMAWQQVYV